MRLVQRTRRHRLYLHLIATLYRSAKAANPDLAEDIIFAVPGEDATTLESSPPAATGVFTDVPLGSFADAWIEQLAAEGITSGCGAGIYCPDDAVTRDQMAVFLVRTFGL